MYLLLIFFNLDFVENFYEWIIVCRFQCIELLVRRNLVLLLPRAHGCVVAKNFCRREITIAVSADFYLIEQFFTLKVFSFFGFGLDTLPWFPDVLLHNDEDEELNKDDC